MEIKKAHYKSVPRGSKNMNLFCFGVKSLSLDGPKSFVQVAFHEVSGKTSNLACAGSDHNFKVALIGQIGFTGFLVGKNNQCLRYRALGEVCLKIFPLDLHLLLLDAHPCENCLRQQTCLDFKTFLLAHWLLCSF